MRRYKSRLRRPFAWMKAFIPLRMLVKRLNWAAAELSMLKLAVLVELANRLKSMTTARNTESPFGVAACSNLELDEPIMWQLPR